MRKKLIVGVAVLPLASAANPFDLGQALTDMNCKEFQFRRELDPTHLGLKKLIPNPHLMNMILRTFGKGCTHPLWQSLNDLLSPKYSEPADFTDSRGGEGVATMKNLINYVRGPTIPVDAKELVDSISPRNEVVKKLIEAREPTRRPVDWPLHVLKQYLGDPRVTVDRFPALYEVFVLRKRPYDRKGSSQFLLKLMNHVASERWNGLVPLHPDPEDVGEMTAVNLYLKDLYFESFYLETLFSERSENVINYNTRYLLAGSDKAVEHCQSLCTDIRPQECYACYQHHVASGKANLVERAEDYLVRACNGDRSYCPDSCGVKDTHFVLTRLLNAIKNQDQPDTRYEQLKKAVSEVPVRELHIVLTSLGFSFDGYPRMSQFVGVRSHLELAFEEIEALSDLERAISEGGEFSQLVHFILKLFRDASYSRFIREHKLLTQKGLQRLVLGLQTPSSIPHKSLEEMVPDATSRTAFQGKPDQDIVVELVKGIKQGMDDHMLRLLDYELLRQPNNDSLQTLAIQDLVASTSPRVESVPVTWFYREIEKGQAKRQFVHGWSDDFMTKVVGKIKQLRHHREYWMNVVALAIADDFGVAERDLNKAKAPEQTWEQYAAEPSANAKLLEHVNCRDCSKCGAHCRCEKYKKLGPIACYVAGYLGYLWRFEEIRGVVDFAIYCDAYTTTVHTEEPQELRRATWQAVYRTIAENTLLDAVENITDDMKAALVGIPYTSPLWTKYPDVLGSSPKFSSFVAYVKNFIVKNCTKEYPYLLNAYTRFKAPGVEDQALEFDTIRKMMEEFTEALANPKNQESAYQELRVRLYDAFFSKTNAYHEKFKAEFEKSIWDDAIKGIAAHILQRVKEEADPSSMKDRIRRAMQLLLKTATRQDWDVFMSLTKNDTTNIRNEVMKAVPNKSVWLAIHEAAGFETFEELLLQTSTYLPQLAALCGILQEWFDKLPLDEYKINEESAASETPRKTFRLLAAIHNDSEPSCIPPRYAAFKKALSDSSFGQSGENVPAVLKEGWKDQFDAWSKPTLRTFHAAGLELLIDQYFASWKGDATKREASREALKPLLDETMKVALDYDQGHVNLGVSFETALQRYALDLMSADHDREGGIFSKETHELVDLALLYSETTGNAIKTALVNLLGPMMNALGTFFGNDAATSLTVLRSAAQELPLVGAAGGDQEKANYVISTIKAAFLLSPDGDGLKSFEDSEKIITTSGAQIGTPRVLDPCPLSLRAGSGVPCGSQFLRAPTPIGGGPPPPPPPPPT